MPRSLLALGILLSLGCHRARSTAAPSSGPSALHVAFETAKAECGAGERAACVTLGGFYQRGEVAAKDYKTAHALFARACEDGDGLACGYDASVLLEGGFGIDKDTRTATQLFERSCTSGAEEACCNLGTLYLQGEGVKKDVPRGLELLGSACDRHDAEACRTMGTYYETGEDVPADLARAITLYDKACTGDDIEGCYLLGYQYTLEPHRDLDRARALLKRALEASCKDLADIR